MGVLLRVAVIALPLLELAVFIKIGAAIGALATILLLILTTIAGVKLVRERGLAILRRCREALDRGELPAGPLFDDACLVLAGLLLILPGFLSDVIAIALLVPPVRHGLFGWLSRHVDVVVRHGGGPFPRRSGGGRGGPPVIEGEYHEVRGNAGDLPRSGGDGGGDSRWGRG
jgi:UPF0716 protein FxsA